jgi:hypothetical protein
MPGHATEGRDPAANLPGADAASREQHGKLTSLQGNDNLYAEWEREDMGKMRRLAATALASALVLGFVACGGDDDDSSGGISTNKGGGTPDGFAASPSFLKKVVDETDGESFRYTATVDMGGLLGSGSGASDTPLLTGETDGELQAMHMDLGAAFGSIGEATGEDLGSMGDAFKMDTVIDGDTMYIHAPFFASMGSLGGPQADDLKVLATGWGKVDVKALGAAGASGLDTSQSMDPKVFLDMLRKTGKVKELGTDTIDGVKVTGLSAEVNFGDLAQSQNLDSSQLGDVGDLADMTFPMEVWVDGDNLLRRISFSFDLESLSKAVDDAGEDSDALGDLGGMEYGMTMDFKDYGDEIEIEVPKDAKDVTEAFKNLSEMGADSSGLGSDVGSGLDLGT